jgi:hypothetical protein
MDGKPLEVEQVEEHLSSDAGLLPFFELDRKLAWSESFASCIQDRRQGCTHSVLSIVRQRVYGIVGGYEDQNDHDSLRSDPVFKLIAERLPDDKDLASQPTISRLENSVTAADLLRMEDWFIDRFVASFSTASSQITLDVDLFDDPTHGDQQLTFFHGFYEQYQYLVRVITCAENDLVVLPTLLFGTAHASLGTAVDLRRIINRLRERFPDVRILVRCDSGFANPKLYEALEELRVEFSIGMAMNSKLQRITAELLETAVKQYEASQQPQRLFTELDYQANSWSRVRRVIVKCEANSQGTNRRAVVTNRAGAAVCPEGAYDDYANRGESENRNKELKCELATDRLSDHRYMANAFRMMMHVLAANLLVTMRFAAADAPSVEQVKSDMPLEARTAKQKRRYFNRRRREDPLGEGHACTWRLRFIKVAARIVASTRRIRILIPQGWPYFDHYSAVIRAIHAFCPPAISTG